MIGFPLVRDRQVAVDDGSGRWHCIREPVEHHEGPAPRHPEKLVAVLGLADRHGVTFAGRQGTKK